MNHGIINSIIILSGAKLRRIQQIIFVLLFLAVKIVYAESSYGPDIFGLGHFVERETKPLYTVQDSGVQMNFRTSKDEYQELIALIVTSSFGTVGPILFSSAFYPFTPQFLIYKELLIVIGGETLIVVNYQDGLYHLIPVRATLMFLDDDKVYLESSDRWGQGYNLSINKRISIYSSRDRPYDPKKARAGKRIEKGGKIIEQTDAWKRLSQQ
jgi:hypothetical protein